MVLGFQILDFKETGHPYARLLPNPVPKILDHIITHNPKSNDTATPPSTEASDRRRTRSESVDLISEQSWPSEWSINKSLFKQAYKRLHQESLPLLEYLQGVPPAESEPSSSPKSLQNSTLTRSDPVTASSTLSLSASNHRSTSAEEAIYNRPIGPIMPSNNPGPTNNPANEPEDQSHDTNNGFSERQMATLESLFQRFADRIGNANGDTSGGNTNVTNTNNGNTSDDGVTNNNNRHRRSNANGNDNRHRRENANNNANNNANGNTSNNGQQDDRDHTTGDTYVSRERQFRPQTVGYFDPKPDVMPIDVKDTHNVYHNVFSFTARLRVKATTMDEAFLQQNVDACLLGAADEWYTTQIEYATRQGFRFDPKGIECWCNALEARFRESPSRSLSMLENIRYTIKDARNRRDPADYVASIVLNGKNSRIATTEESQVMLAYEHMEGELRRDLSLPKASSTVAGLLTELRNLKDLWFDIYEHTKTSDNRRDNKQGGNAGQYAANTNPFRRQATGNPGAAAYRPGSGYDYGGPSRLYNDNQTPYQRPWLPYEQYIQQRYNANPQQQATQVQQRQLPGGRQQLQITSGTQNANTSTGTNPSGNPVGGTQTGTRQPNANGGYNNRNPYRTDNRQNARPPFARTYYHDTNTDFQEGGMPYDEQAEYQAFEDDYYGAVNWTQSNDTAYQSNDTDDKNQGDSKGDGNANPVEGDETVETHFVTSHRVPIVCRNCGIDFLSKNALHRHLKAKECKSTTGTSTKSAAEPKCEENKDPVVIKSRSTDKPIAGYAFRGYRYVVAEAKFSANGSLADICFDTGCVMSLVDRQFLREQVPDVEIRKMPTPMTVRGIGSKRHEASEFVSLEMYLPGNGRRVALIEREFHIVDELTAKALVGVDILKPENIAINLSCDSMTIGACDDIVVPITVHTRSPGPRTNATVFAQKQMTVQPRSNVAIPITGPRRMLELPRDRDLFFEPASLNELSTYAHVVDHTLTEVFVRNDTDRPITLQRRSKLGNITELDTTECYSISSSNHELAAKAPKRLPRRFDIRNVMATDAAFATAIGNADSATETVHQTGVTIHGSPSAASSIAAVVESFPNLWKDTGNAKISESEFMEIPLVENWRDLYKPGQAKVYPVGQRDKAVIDSAFDKLHEQNRMEWTTTATPFSFPCFVVWKDTPDGAKGRVVVDIRALNKITMPDSYPVPLQSEILALIRGAKYISVIDAASFFYQWWVKYSHRLRLTVSSHRGQETFKVPVMGFRNSPAYVQRMIDGILRPFRDFCRAYVDDIVIFSASLEEHTAQLHQVFTKLDEFNIHISPRKSFLGYPSVHLLGQKVDALGLATNEEKLAAIANLTFPRTLRQLETYLGMTGYQRQYVPFYAAVCKPLQLRKTYLSKDVKHVQGNERKKLAGKTHLTVPTPKELNAFHQLQKFFSSPANLVHHDHKRVLFIDIDASKEFGFGAHAYHDAKDKDWIKDALIAPPQQKSKQSVLFLSRLISDAETRYWPTELEIAGLVWVVKKMRHLIEASTHATVIYTDHSAAVSIVRQTSLNTSSIEKLNLRLVRASEFLQRFRIDVRYKPGKTNIIPDALSRLTSRDYKPSDESLDALTIQCFPVTMVEISQEFRQRLLDGYQEPRWSRICKMIRDNEALGENAAKLPYKFVNELLYFNDDEKGLRLCIPTALEGEVFTLVHDEMGHPGYARTHERLTEGVFIYNMASKLHEFLRHCPQCKINQTPRHRPYGSMQPILSPSRPFHTLCLDFVLALPESVPDGYETIMSITDKFSKAVTYLPGKSTWAGKEWATRVLDRMAALNWGLPRAIISDRDRKFVAGLWKQIFHQLKVKLYYSTAYHPQTDGMSERSNQTAEIALRYYITNLEDSRRWPDILHRMSAALNNSTNYSSTHRTATQVMYGFRTREALDLLRPYDPAESTHDPHRDTNTSSQPQPLTTRAVSAPAFPVVTRQQTQNQDTQAEDHRDDDANDTENVQPSQLAAMDEYRPAHIDAKDAIAFATMKMKAYYDNRHTPMYFDVGDMVKLRLHRGYKVPGILPHKIGPQFVGPFRVTERIGKLAYRLQLPDNMKIHNVISVAMLEPMPNPSDDPYYRQPPPPPPVVVDGEIEHVIERLVDKRRIRRGRGWSTQYLIKWEGYGPEHNTWQPKHTVADTSALEEFELLNGSDSGVH